MTLYDPFNLLTDQQRQLAEGLLQRHNGHLSISQIAEGIQSCLKNARELQSDARLLAESQRWARAVSLLVASMEEIGKISVLSAMARIPSNNQRLWGDQWSSFRSHADKSTFAFTHTCPDESRTNPGALFLAVIAQRGLSGLCERIRQFGIYVDFHAVEHRWLSPAEVTQRDFEQWIARSEAGLNRFDVMNDLGLYSSRALQIQQEIYAHLNANRPKRRDVTPADVARHIDDGPELAKQYYKRLIDEGIIPPNADLTCLGQPLSELR